MTGTEAKTKPRELQVGDFISYSWGYEQTNIEFYRVERRSPHNVWLQRVLAEYVGDTGPFSGTVKPTSVTYEDKPTVRKKRQPGWDGQEYVAFDHGVGTICEADSTHHISWGG